MSGPAPKRPEARRRRNPPASGEWVELEPLERPVLPSARRDWSPRVKALWAAWRQDPATGQYSPADVAACVDLAACFEELPASEQRLRMDGLGLSPKGRRNLRWRLAPTDPPLIPPPSGSKVTRLRAV